MLKVDLTNKKILIVGASSDLAVSLNKVLYNLGAVVGFHYNKNKEPLLKYVESKKVKLFQKTLDTDVSCYELVDDFVQWAESIDCLIQLSGDIKRTVHWDSLVEKDWKHDLNVNLILPFFLAQRATKYMKEVGGKIILMSTASASHGGGTTSLAYGIAKAGIECLVKTLARDCAKYNILVNAVAPGFFLTKFHTEKMKRTQKQFEERIKLIPLRRSGTMDEIAGTILFLLSDYSTYITGQVLTVSGGDWL